MTIKVWYQLRIGDYLQGDSDAVYLEAGKEIVDLRNAIKEKRTTKLSHCDAADLIVFLAGGDPKKNEPIDPGDPIPTGTTSKTPLIVVAPAPPPPQQQQPQGPHLSRAYNVSFTILRDNRQADGLRKLITNAASRQTAFYASHSHSETTQNLHMAAFLSEEVPADFDISAWPQSGDGSPRFLHVRLHFLSYEKVAAFQNEVIALLQDRPSAVFVDTETKSLSPEQDALIKTSIVVPIELPHGVHDSHYIPRGSASSISPLGEPFDSKEECDLSVTVTASLPVGCVGNFNEDDPLWPGHAIEKRSAFVIFHEKAHIFPHRNCVKFKQKDGKKTKVATEYEWLDDPADAEFNFLYLSANMHACYDGTGHGRGALTATRPAICIEPLARTVEDSTGFKRFKVDKIGGEYRAKIPLRVWCMSEDVANRVKSMLAEGAQTGRDKSTGLHYFENIYIECVHRQIAMGREELLLGDSQERVFVYNKKVPFMDERLSSAWSLTGDGNLSSTEVMEKCLLWNANKTWNEEWKGNVSERTFMSRTV
jgi:hypothetical protein